MCVLSMCVYLLDCTKPRDLVLSFSSKPKMLELGPSHGRSMTLDRLQHVINELHCLYIYIYIYTVSL